MCTALGLLASSAPRSAPGQFKRPRLGDPPSATGVTCAAPAGGDNATCAGAEGKLRARCPSPNQTAGAPGGGPQGRRQRPRLGAPITLTVGPCSSATGPGSRQWPRVGAPPAGGPRSSSTMRPGGCHRQPRLGTLQPLAQGPRSTSTKRPGCIRLPRTGALLAIAEGPCSTSTSRPGSGGLSPTSRKRARPSGQERSVSLPLGTAMSAPPSAPTTTKCTKLAPSTARHSRPYDYG